MHVVKRFLFLWVTVIIAGMYLQAMAAEKTHFSTMPKTNNGKKWQIAYYEGGPYIDYKMIFSETIKALMEMGWIEKQPLPTFAGEETSDLWNWLATSAKSNYLEFLIDGHYSANWEDAKRAKMVDAILKRLNTKRDIDLMVALGTWAGKDLANDSHSTNTMVLSASDAVGAGIIKSVEDSGYDHIHAYVDPNRAERQLLFFHDMIGFKKLGIIYEDSIIGKSYAALDTAERIAQKRHFKIERCFAVSDIPDVVKKEKEYIDCFKNLAQKTDAVYLTYHGGLTYQSIPKIVEIANSHQLPTFSQSGSQEVKYGVLASLSQAGFKYVGRFHAETFAKVFNGAKPNDLDQYFDEPTRFALNLKTASIIGYDAPVDILGTADEVYEEIQLPRLNSP